MAEAVKECRRCLAARPVVDFCADKRTSDGLRKWCKACWNAYMRARWADGRIDRNKKSVSDKAWREANPVKVKTINRRSRLKRFFGITLEQYDGMLAAQGRCCAACGSSDSGDRRFDTFAVDHDHDTGKVRGLLCANCNRALGLVKDDPDTLVALAAYVLQTRDVIGASA